MSGPTSGVPDLPAIDEITHRYAVFSTTRERVDFTPALAQFLRIAQVEGVRPLLRTQADATLSAHLVAELFAHGASWVVRAPGGPVIDALAGRQISSYDDVGDPQILATRPLAQLPDERSVPAYGAVNLEVLLHHRASSSLHVGHLVEDVFAGLGAAPPDAWGSFEPLTSLWNITEVTQRAQREMPSSTVMRVASPDGAWATVQYERGQAGVVERLRGGVVVGSYAEAARTAATRAKDLLRSLAGTSTVVAAMASLVDVDAANAFRVRVRRPETPVAALVGPWAISEADIDVPAMIEGYGAEQLGRRAVPSLLFGFDGPLRAPWLNLAQILNAIGWDNLAHAFGLDQEGRHGG